MTFLHIAVSLVSLTFGQEQLSSDDNLSKSKPGPEVIKLFPCSTQLSMNFFNAH